IYLDLYSFSNQKPKNRMGPLRPAILFLGFAFVLTQSTAAIYSRLPRAKHEANGRKCLFWDQF
ncbi:MAG: hypothetical protein ACK56Y_12125, partial [Pseudanabaena sp.]